MGNSLIIKNKMNFWLQYFLYICRWQMSNFILAPCIAIFKHSPSMWGTQEDWIAAGFSNLVGAIIFFWVDRFIFKNKN